MARRRTSCRLVAGLGVAGTALALASASFACTVFLGKMTVTGNASPGVVTVVGNTTSMGFCPGYPYGKAKATRGGTITITASKAGKLICEPEFNNRLSQGITTWTTSTAQRSSARTRPIRTTRTAAAAGRSTA